jgi:hypothetical protein
LARAGTTRPVGKARARIVLEEHRGQALRLIAHLAEHGHLNESEFLRLMNGEGG